MEIKAFERVAYAHRLLANVNENKKLQSPQEKFAINLQNFVKDENIIYLLNDREQVKYDILDLIEKIPDVEYKNPKCFALGYYVISNFKIDKKKVNSSYIKKILNNLLVKDENTDKISSEITKEDIIRYARFIIKKLL